MWPLHSRSRPLGHAFAHLPSSSSSSSAPPSPTDATDRADRAPAATTAPTRNSPRALSARRLKWQRRLSGRAFHLLVLALVLLDLATIVADLVLVLTHSEYKPTHAVERAAHALAATSIAILSLFCVEFVAAAAVFGPRAWFSEPLHCFDVVVVLASLALEAALFHLESQVGLEGIVSLLVAGRLWRLARVAYTATEATKAEEEVEEARRRRKADGASGAEVSRLRQLVASLRTQLAEAGVAERSTPLDEGGGGAGGGGAAAGGRPPTS